MAKCLEDDGFECINEDPEEFTIVHLNFKPENLTARWLVFYLSRTKGGPTKDETLGMT